MKPPIFLLLSWILVTTPASAGQFEKNFAGGPDTTISHISTGGFWEQGGKYGTCRVIIRNLGWEHTRSYVYLQWLKTDDKNKKVIAFKTIPISEFNTGDWRTVRNVEYQNEAFAIYYIIRGRKKLDKAMLRPEVPGKYRITF